MNKNIVVINLIGALLIPLFVVFELNPFLVSFVVGIGMIYFLLKKSGGFITSIFAWNLGFLFIICADGLLNYSEIAEQIDVFHAQKTSFLFNYSNFFINLAYIYFFPNDHFRSNLSKSWNIETYDRQTTINLIVIIVFYVLFILFKLPSALESLISGRFARISGSKVGGLATESRSIFQAVLGPIVTASGVIIPSLIYHFLYTRNYRNKLILALIVSLPIFIIFLMSGTRYYVLFSGGAFLITYLYYKNKPIRNFALVMGFSFFGFVGASVISALRGQGLSVLEEQKEVHIQYDRTEGTMKYMTMVVDYYSLRDLEMGTSTIANFIVWIPRSVWKEKPTLFGYWFIRDYYGSNFDRSTKFSAPASYLAEAYSDFGVLGVGILSFLMSIIFAWVDKRLLFLRDVFTIKKIVFYILVPMIFFLPRQLNITITMFLGVFVLFLMMKVFSTNYKKKLAVPPANQVEHDIN